MHAGSAIVDVTPGESVPIAGSGPQERFSTGVHDPLHVRALVVDDGTTAAGLASVDTLWVSRDLVSSVERRLAQDGVHLDAILLCATHTHSAPWFPVTIDDPRTPAEFHGSENGFTRENAAAFADRLAERVAESIANAHGSRAPAALRIGSATPDGLAVNRRSAGGVFGEVSFPESVAAKRDPKADVAPELTAVVVESSGSEAVLFSYPVHTNAFGGTELSADFPGVACQRIADRRDATPLFVNGAAGDVIHPHRRERDRYESGEAYMDAMGEALADTALDAVADAEDGDAVSAPKVTTAHREVDVRLRAADSRVVENALRSRLSAAENECERRDLSFDNPLTQPEPGSVARERFYLDRLLALDEWDRETLAAPLDYVEIGPVGLLGLPVEPFVRHGLDVAAAGTAETTLVAGYANGYLGYCPTVEGFAYGGYEVETCPFTPAGVRALRDAAFELVR